MGGFFGTFFSSKTKTGETPFKFSEEDFKNRHLRSFVQQHRIERMPLPTDEKGLKRFFKKDYIKNIEQLKISAKLIETLKEVTGNKYISYIMTIKLETSRKDMVDILFQETENNELYKILKDKYKDNDKIIDEYKELYTRETVTKDPDLAYGDDIEIFNAACNIILKKYIEDSQDAINRYIIKDLKDLKDLKE